VLAEQLSRPQGALAGTGANSRGLVLVAGLLLLVGGVVLIASDDAVLAVRRARRRH